jgi:integrase/recombinase XerD
MVARWGHVAPASWNRHLATLRSFFAWCARRNWTNGNPTDGIDRRRVPTHDSRVIAYSDLEALWARRDVALREKVFWKMLYETAGRASEILNLDVDDLDLANKQATIISKGGARATVHWQSGTARLLPKYLKDRTRGPLFLTNIKPGPSHTPAAGDLCPDTGRARLSYARAETIFKQTSSGNTLHQLRHSSLTAWAENGVDVPMLMARSRHRSYRSLQRYLAPSDAALARLTAELDPAARRRTR